MPGCENNKRTVGLCDMHYQRFLKSGDVGAARTKRVRGSPDALTKTCGMCREEKPKAAFQRQKRARDGLQSWCRWCTRIANFSGKYGIPIEEVRDFARSNEVNGCAICGVRNDLVIDHCHASNQLRGILCRQCNTGIGMFKHDEETMKSAINYLLKLDVELTAS